jgi:hypothetical protein
MLFTLRVVGNRDLFFEQARVTDYNGEKSGEEGMQGWKGLFDPLMCLH